MKVTRTSTYTIELDEPQAEKLAASLGRLLTAAQHMEPKAYDQLVNTHTVDDLLALRTALYNVLPEERQ